MKQGIQKECQKRVISDEKAIQSHTVTNPKEKGRSMVEMLGVLAVIGVLSVGGIMGYKYGMMKYRVNETINELNIMANTYGVQMQQMSEEQTLPSEGELLSEENAVTRMGYGYEVLGFDNHFEIALFNVPNPECEQLQKTGWELPYEIKAETVTVESCGELVYYIDNGLTGTLTEYIDSDAEDDEEDDDEKNNQCGMFGYWDGSQCICDKGYKGAKCDKCDISAGFDSQDKNGRCYRSTEKSDCTYDIYCNSAGSIADWLSNCNCYECKPGYYGKHCELTEENGVACNGRGVWINSTVTGSGCNCRYGYYGQYCEYTDSQDDCSGRGTRIAYGSCFCEQGYYGENCENCEPEYYNSSTCKEQGSFEPIICEHGTRIKINEEEVCVCDIGYGGNRCETPVCSGNGRLDTFGNCMCKNGYGGKDCSIPVCNGNGIQDENGNCVCDNKYSGSDCKERVCSGKGVFDENKECLCYEGYYSTGNDCVSVTNDCNGHGYRNQNGECICKNSDGNEVYDSKDDCATRLCNGVGSVSPYTGKCSCPRGYSGDNCETIECSGYGYKDSNGKCVCIGSTNSSYGSNSTKRTGDNCEKSICTADNPSYNGWFDYTTGKCSCWDGYYGTETNCIKAESACQNNGILINGKCVCSAEYEGTDCGTRTCNGRGYKDINGKCVCSNNFTHGGTHFFGGENCEYDCSVLECGTEGWGVYLNDKCTCVYPGA